MRSYSFRIALTVLLVVFAWLFPITPLQAQGKRETDRLLQGKVTKNEAQHLVLKRYPGATIKHCELNTSQDPSVWEIQFVKAGDDRVQTARVDGRAGKLLP